MKEDEEGTREEGKGREERKGMKIKGKTKIHWCLHVFLLKVIKVSAYLDW